MSKDENDSLIKTPSVLPNFNVLNTAMAADRTLMAWIRTGLSMFTFGFTLFKVLQAVQASTHSLPSDNMPRNAGVALVAIGVMAVLMGLVEFWHTRRQLGLIEGLRLPRSPTAIMALMTAGVGGFLIVVIFASLI